MRKVLLLLVSGLLLSVASACNGDDDDDAGDDDDDGDTPPSITCDAEDTLKLESNVYGSSLSIVTANGGGTFMNAGGEDVGYLDISLVYGSGSEFGVAYVYVEFEDLIMQGGSSEGRGYVIDSARNLSVGNCETGGFVSRIWSIDTEEEGAEEYRWELKALKEDPYCTGDSVSGTATGCWYIEPF